jgi:PAS domain S-box-containing protein
MATRIKTRLGKRAKKTNGARATMVVPAETTADAQEIVHAIRRGKVDALVMAGPEGDQVLTLQNSEHPYRVLVETVNDGAATLDRAGTILYANSRFGAILRASEGALIGSLLQSHVSPADHEKLQQLIAKGLRGGVHGEITLDGSGSRPRLVRLAFNPLTNSARENVCVVATELTELIEANEALRSNEESLRQLSARLLKLQDDERRRIARDLHDITGQKLAAQSMALSQVLQRQTAGLDADSQRLLLECVSLSKQVGEEIRTLSYLLHPPLLDELGLSSAVKWYAEGFEQRTGIAVEVDIASDFLRLTPEMEVTLFRIIQESLTNIQRYSGSKKAQVRVQATGNKVIEVQIRDFGKGMAQGVLNSAAGATAPLGVGIQGMRERMRQLAGTLEITSRLNQGTLVTARLPFLHSPKDASAEFASATAPSSIAAKEEPGSSGNISRKQILIADDHEMLRRGLRTMLEREPDWEICGEAVNGQEAVDKAISLSPDLVILDINMPVLNGLAAVRLIRRNRPQTKILIFTVHDSEQTLKEIQSVGAHGYLSKGNASEDLLRVVKELLESKTSSVAPITSAN